MGFIYLTYAEYLSYCSASFFGSLMAIGVLGVLFYFLVKALIFLAPFILVMMVASLILCVARHGVKQFFYGLKNFIICLLVTAVIAGIFVGLAALCADNDHPVLAVTLSIPGLIAAFYGIFFSIIVFVHGIRNSEADKDKKFPGFMIFCFILYLAMVYLIQNTMLPARVGPVSLTAIIVLVYVVFVNLKRKHGVFKSLLLGIVPLISVFTIRMFYDMRGDVPSLTFIQYLEIIAYNLGIFEIPSLIIGLINNKRNKNTQ